MIGVGMVYPIFPIIFTDPSSPAFLLAGYSQHWQFFIAGFVVAIGGLMQFVSAPIFGELSDIYGRKKLLILGVGLLAISQIFFGFGVQIGSLLLLLISRAVAGFAGGNFSIAQAAIADVSDPQDRAKNFGLMGAAFGLGIIVGPVLGGWLTNVTGDAGAPFWFAGVLGIVNVIFLSWLLPETNRHPRAEKSFSIWKGVHNIRDAFLDVDARPVYLSNFLYMSGFAFFTTFVGILLVNKFGFTAGGIGLFFGIVGGWVVITQGFILRIVTHRYGEHQLLYSTLILLALTIAIYPFLPSVAWLYAVLPLLAIAQGVSMASMSSLVSRSVSAAKQGAALGINGSLVALSQGIIPLFAGAASGVIGLTAPFVVGAFFIVAAWAVLFLQRR